MNLAPWLAEAWTKLTARAANGGLPHALLLVGPDGIGKRAFAEHLAAYLLCQQRDAAPCGRCRSCELFGLRAQRDPEETRPDGSLAQPSGYPLHPDAKFVGFTLNDKSKKMYGEVVVEQIRTLSAWFALTPQLGGAQVALIEPADAMNVAAANALLKTLEEPSAGRYLLLVTAHPARLPATIRSRCQRIAFHLPAADVALDWLVRQKLDRKQACAALKASGGNPGLALTWAKSGRLALRDEVATQLRNLQLGKANAVDVANAWGKAEPDARLWFAATLAHDESNALARRAQGPLALTADADLTKLSAWFDHANRARDLLRGPLRAELVLLEVLLAWTQMVRPLAAGRTPRTSPGS
jgi:DNA polymerase-3 subunit delta'